jgi:thioredoxin reductase
MAHGRHKTEKKPGSPGYSAEWSGVSYAPHCDNSCTCPIHTEEPLHLEGHGAHYCPVCDDYKTPSPTCTRR